MWLYFFLTCLWDHPRESVMRLRTFVVEPSRWSRMRQGAQIAKRNRKEMKRAERILRGLRISLRFHEQKWPNTHAKRTCCQVGGFNQVLDSSQGIHRGSLLTAFKELFMAACLTSRCFAGLRIHPACAHTVVQELWRAIEWHRIYPMRTG